MRVVRRRNRGARRENLPVRALHEMALERHRLHLGIRLRLRRDHLELGVKLRDAVLHEEAEQVETDDEALAGGRGRIFAQSW